MERLVLKGCGTALLTPFRNGAVDYDAYSAHIMRQVKEGVDFLVPLATTGETPTLSSEEKVKMLELTREKAGGKILLTGVGSNSVQATLDNVKLLSAHGADAYLVVCPYYNKPTQKGLYDYFRFIAEHVDKPVVIYNVPGRTGVNMLPETTLALAKDCPNIIATKEAAGNCSQVAAIVREAPSGFSVLSGDDDLTLPFMALGAQGVISVASNILPSEVSEMVALLSEGQMEKARKIHFTLMPLFKACFIESNPIPAKAAMNILGLMTSEVRMPLSQAGEATVEKMKSVLNGILHTQA